MSKYGFSVGEVAKAIGVETHTVRFWFGELQCYFSPYIGAGGRRYFSEQDLATFKKIQELTHTKGYRLNVIKSNKLLITQSTQESQALNIITDIEKQINSIINIL